MPHIPSRALALIAATGVTALALAGCGRSAGDEPGPIGAIDDGPATGVVEVWAPEGDASGLDDLLAPFLADNPDLDLQLTLIPSDQYQTKLQSAISAGTAPDLAQLYTEVQSTFTVGGAFAPVPEGVVDSDVFFPGSWEAGVVDGVAYSVPWYAYTYALIYRADLAETAGVDAPATWEDTVPFFEALQGAGAEHGFGAEVSWSSYSGIYLSLYDWQAGGELLTADGSAWNLDTPEMAAAVEYFASLFTEGTAATDSPSFLDSQPYLVQGRTASMISGPWVIGQLDGVAEEDGWTAEHIATAPLPAGPAGAYSSVAGGSWGVLSDAENADAAWKIVRYLSDPDVQLTQFEDFGSMPALPAVWEEPAIADQPLLDAFFEQLSTAKALPAVPTFMQVATQMGVELEKVVKQGLSPEDAAANLQTFAESIGLGRE